MADFDKERTVAVEAVKEAARLCQAVQVHLEPNVLEKKDRSPVTVADFGSQALVCRALHEAFPYDPIMAEEDSAVLQQAENGSVLGQIVQQIQAIRPGADAETVCSWIDYGNLGGQRERFWTLDPIDGTKGFLRGDQYAIALALIVGGEVQVAALGCPNLIAQDAVEQRGVIFSAVRGQGAARLPLGEGVSVPVRVSDTVDPTEARFCESFVSAHSSHDAAADVAEQLGITEPSLRLDSQAKYAVVARGEADIYLRLPRTSTTYVERIWDHAAGTLVVTEAGGTATDIHGRPLAFRYGRLLEKNRGVVVTNGHLHEQVLAALKTVGVE